MNAPDSSQKVTTAEAVNLFESLVRRDPDATLAHAMQILQGSGASIPVEKIESTSACLSEVETLIQAHGNDCRLADFLPDRRHGTEAGPGVHG